ncbi:MAG: glycosyltransferase [Spirosomataceae bacterium]
MLLIFDTHPVQYRAPLWRAIQQLYPGSIHVVYASDCSVKGHQDEGFGQTVAWDEPLLAGYPYTILNCEKGQPLSGWGSLTGKGVKEVIAHTRPSAVLLTGIYYRYESVAWYYARLAGIPVWLRTETQDEAFQRSRFKSFLRSLVYKIAYKGFQKFFYIGQLNKLHYQHHGVSPNRLLAAHYCTVNRYEGMSLAEKKQLRTQIRSQAGITTDKWVVGFSGKFIEKKNPLLLFQSLAYLPDELREKIHFYYVGSGTLEEALRQKAREASDTWGIKTTFTGFVNQSQIGEHYLAMDVMVLPSRRMGETWGLVANEALQAGCGVVVSDAVGCGADFMTWERVRVFSEGDTQHLAKQLASLSRFETDLEWATANLESYSMMAAAQAIAHEIPLNP